MENIIDNLGKVQPNKSDLINLIDNITPDIEKYLFAKSRNIRKKYYGNKVFIRGLIEYSNYCKNDCYYCGIRSGNKNLHRYRLSKDEIINCCQNGYNLGFRTFVLQGGEDLYYTDDHTVDIIRSIKQSYPDCAVTLSMGERSKESYKRLKEAGADRYLLRFESSNNDHYSKLHPPYLSGQNRKECLWNLKQAGFTTGGGFMVGSPYQTTENIAEDLLFLHELKPDMVGIGPFIPHKESIFKDYPAGTISSTMVILAITRLMLPKALIPSTTALHSVDLNSRKLALQVACNVVMPNLSPQQNRGDYQLYNHKAYLGSEAAESLNNLQKELEDIGYTVSVERGDPVV